jgi:hypothetical protein
MHFRVMICRLACSTSLYQAGTILSSINQNNIRNVARTGYIMSNVGNSLFTGIIIITPATKYMDPTKQIAVSNTLEAPNSYINENTRIIYKHIVISI